MPNEIRATTTTRASSRLKALRQNEPLCSIRPFAIIYNILLDMRKVNVSCLSGSWGRGTIYLPPVGRWVRIIHHWVCHACRTTPWPTVIFPVTQNHSHWAAWLQRHICANNVFRVVTWKCNGGNRTYDLFIASPAYSPLHHCAKICTHTIALSARVEQFTAAPAKRHELCAFQASTENISIWELVNHGALWLFAVLCLRNTLTYLLTYLPCPQDVSHFFAITLKTDRQFRSNLACIATR